jgi:hypothetical protein
MAPYDFAEVHGQALMMKAVSISEMSVYFNEIIQRCIPEGNHPHCQTGFILIHVTTKHSWL